MRSTTSPALSREQAERAVSILVPISRGEHGRSIFDYPTADDPFARFTVNWGDGEPLRRSALAAAAAIVDQGQLEVTLLEPALGGARLRR